MPSAPPQRSRIQPQTPPQGFEAIYANPLPWLIALAVAHVIVRVAVSPALKWDEAQQILWTQHLQWGVNQLLGPGVLALALLKQALIALTCMFMWLAARELMGKRAAWWAAASLWLLPPFGWYAVNDLTHTVLAVTMTCAAWWLLLRIMRRGGAGCRGEFAALGLACGFGLLAKYNFALMLAVFVAALLSVRQTRRALFGPGWWLAVLTGLAVAAPHGWWLLAHWHTATAETFKLMTVAPQSGPGAGLGDLLTATLETLTLWAILALAAFRAGWWRRPASAPQIAAPWLRTVSGRYLTLMVIVLLAMVLITDMTTLKSRWILPLLAPVPLLAFALRPELDAAPRGKVFTGLTLAVIAVILAAAAAQPWFAYIDGKAHPFNVPAVQLAQALQSAGYDGRGRIIAADHMLAGALRTRFPAAQAADCHGTGDAAACVATQINEAGREGQGWLVISYAGRTEPGWWDQALARIPESARLPRGHLSIPYRMVRRNQPPASYDFVWQPAPARQPQISP